MQYIIAAGDTLGAIARRSGCTLEQLLTLNPTLRANPDRLAIGQAIALPQGAAPAPASWLLGSLSEHYETGGRGSTTVSGGVGDAGGVSYGSYQMTSAGGGTVTIFVREPSFPWRADFAALTAYLTGSSTLVSTLDESDIAFLVWPWSEQDSTMPYANKSLYKASVLRLLSLTLDPDDDTVDVLAKYAVGFGADPNRWSFLTGDTAAIRELVGTSFLAQDTTGEFSFMPGNFANTQRIVLVNQAGRITPEVIICQRPVGKDA